MIASPLLMAVGMTLLRSFVIAAGACWLANQWLKSHREQTFFSKGVWWLFLLAPTLTPPLLIGYAYSNTQFSLVAHPWCNELLYSFLLLFRMMPLAWLVLFFSPAPPLGASGIYCQELLDGKRGGQEGDGNFQGRFRGRFRGCFRGCFRGGGWWTYGPGRAMVTAMALVFLLVFGEFEIASRLGASSWTVWVFDAQVGGLSWEATGWALILPVSCQWLVFGIAALSLAPTPGTTPGSTPGSIYSPRQGAIAVHGKGGAALWVLGKYLWLILAAVLVCVGPLALLSGSMVRGLSAVWADRLIMQEIGVSLLFACVAAAVVVAIISRFKAIRLGRMLLCLPGMTGSLVVGLMILSIFQTSFFVFLYDTPIPLLAALILMVLPVGMILRAVLASSGSAIYLAEQLSHSSKPAQQAHGRSLLWTLVHRPMGLIFCVLFYLAYIDLPASALLCPSGMSPAGVRLYNLMHYGRYDTLGAMTALTYACPWMIFLLVWLIARGRKVHD